MTWTLLPGKLRSKDCAKYKGSQETKKSIYLKRVRKVLYNWKGRGVRRKREKSSQKCQNICFPGRAATL